MPACVQNVLLGLSSISFATEYIVSDTHTGKRVNILLMHFVLFFCLAMKDFLKTGEITIREWTAALV